MLCEFIPRPTSSDRELCVHAHTKSETRIVPADCNCIVVVSIDSGGWSGSVIPDPVTYFHSPILAGVSYAEWP